MNKEVELKEKKIKELRRCVAFFASVIKYGEGWTSTCQKEYEKAMDNDTNLHKQSKVEESV